MRFDLSKSTVARSQLDRDQIDRAVLLLTVEPGGLPSTSTINVYGIREGLDQDWAESGESHLVWQSSPCRIGVNQQQYLGQVTMQNNGDNLKNLGDAVRIFGAELDDFIRTTTGDLVTIALVRENSANKPTQFKSKEGKPNQAPAFGAAENHRGRSKMNDRNSHLLGSQSAGKGGAGLICCERSALASCLACWRMVASGPAASAVGSVFISPGKGGYSRRCYSGVFVAD